MELKLGDVVFARVQLGGQTKLRPGIVVDQQDGDLRIILGSTKKVTSREEQFVMISEPEEMKAMGLRQITGFELHHRTVMWINEEMAEEVVGKMPKSVEKRVGAAFMYARMNRMI